MSANGDSARVVVIGAGVGGLATAAVLSRAGVDVTVLEAHIYPGGCAGTFFHQGYRFDVGATLAGGFYPGGPMDLVAKQAGIDRWPTRPADPAMLVHLPDLPPIPRFGDDRRWAVYEQAFGAKSLSFFRWQERTADAIWDLALRQPPWPPQYPSQVAHLAEGGVNWLVKDWRNHARLDIIRDAFSTIARRLDNQSKALRLFIDAQLLISAQTTSQYANAVYAASALDLPRRGVVHLEGGMQTISDYLVDSIRRNGGKVVFRTEATRITSQGGKPAGVETRRGEFFPAQVIVANLPPDNIYRLMGLPLPESFPPNPGHGWGAFMAYIGLESKIIPTDFPLHHQIIQAEPLGETNSVFLSISPKWDPSRAPQDKRAITLSTHTDLRPWWNLFTQDRGRYEELKAAYLERMLAAVEEILPGFKSRIDLVMPGTPVTFERFTHRTWGWVGGYPQTSLLGAKKPKLAEGIWMVGDSIFPGQSLPAVALGGLRVAELVLHDKLMGKKVSSPIRRRIQTQSNL